MLATMQRKIALIFLFSVSSILMVIGLYLISGSFIKPANGFTRLFRSSPLSLYKSLDIQYNSYYIAGVSSSHIYLGNRSAPLYVLVTDSILSGTSVFLVEGADKEEFPTGIMSIDSVCFYLSDRITNSVCIGAIRNWQVNKTIHLNILADITLPISSTSFAKRAFLNHPLGYTLAKETDGIFPGKYAPEILENAADGIFSSDGMLNYSPGQALLVYLYFYRNQYICLDTNLNLVYRGRTIDTNAAAKIKTANIISDNSTTLSGPPLIVNRNSCVFEKSLYINSGLKANNENRSAFSHSSVIDVYDLAKGKYESSFYIPDYKGRKIKSFQVCNSKLIAVLDHYLLIYSLNNTGLFR